jgi:hypothetical protein
VLDETLRSGGSMLQAADVCIVPAIRMLESDYDRRALAAARRKAVLDHVNDWIEERLEALDSAAVPVRKAVAAKGAPGPGGFVLGPGATGPLWVACVPAADRADEIVAKLLTSALLERGVGASWVRADTLEQLPLAPDGRAIDAVVISALPPEAVAPARAVCRAVRSRSRDLPLMVGLWDPESDLTKPRERLAAAGAGSLVVTFADCVAALEALAASPPPAARPAAVERGAVLEA